MKLTDRQIRAADVDLNGTVSVEDAQLILIYYTQTKVAGNKIGWDDLLRKKKPAAFLPKQNKDRTASDPCC